MLELGMSLRAQWQPDTDSKDAQISVREDFTRDHELLFHDRNIIERRFQIKLE